MKEIGIRSDWDVVEDYLMVMFNWYKVKVMNVLYMV